MDDKQNKLNSDDFQDKLIKAIKQHEKVEFEKAVYCFLDEVDNFDLDEIMGTVFKKEDFYGSEEEIIIGVPTCMALHSFFSRVFYTFCAITLKHSLKYNSYFSEKQIKGFVSKVLENQDFNNFAEEIFSRLLKELFKLNDIVKQSEQFLAQTLKIHTNEFNNN